MLFTTDWHSRHVPQWEINLAPLCGQPASCLEIGSHEGRSAVWIVEHLLTNPAASLTCIDPWPSAAAEQLFDANIAATGCQCQVRKIKAFSHVALRRLEGEFDFIYLDGNHEARNVLEDAVLCFRLLRSAGILIFDDYLWNRKRRVVHPPKSAIDCFLALWDEWLEVLHLGRQVIVRKTRQPDDLFLVAGSVPGTAQEESDRG